VDKDPTWICVSVPPVKEMLVSCLECNFNRAYNLIYSFNLIYVEQMSLDRSNFPNLSDFSIYASTI
jgi:hypothetical protein